MARALSILGLGPTKVNSSGVRGEVTSHVVGCGVEVEVGGWVIERSLINTDAG